MSWGKDLKKINQAKEIFDKDPKKAFALVEEDKKSIEKFVRKADAFIEVYKKSITLENLKIFDRVKRETPLILDLKRVRIELKEQFEVIIKEIENAKDAYVELSMEMNKL